MTGVMIIAVAVVAMAVAKGSKKDNNGKFLGSSTSMLFGNQNLNAGAAC